MDSQETVETVPMNVLFIILMNVGSIVGIILIPIILIHTIYNIRVCLFSFFVFFLSFIVLLLRLGMFFFLNCHFCDLHFCLKWRKICNMLGAIDAKHRRYKKKPRDTFFGFFLNVYFEISQLR